jgi:hypothetical protein
MELFCLLATEVGWDFLQATGPSNAGNTNRLSFVSSDDCESHKKYRGVALHPPCLVASGDNKFLCSGTQYQILKTAKQIQNCLGSLS